MGVPFLWFAVNLSFSDINSCLVVSLDMIRFHGGILFLIRIKKYVIKHVFRAIFVFRIQ